MDTLSIKLSRYINGNGEKVFEVTGFSGLRKNELPSMYKSSCEYKCWIDYISPLSMSDLSLHIYNSAEHVMTISRGDFMTVDEFNDVNTILEQCAKNLKEVNQKLDDMRSEWCGDVEFVY